MWAYPVEYKDKTTAGKIRKTPINLLTLTMGHQFIG